MQYGWALDPTSPFSLTPLFLSFPNSLQLFIVQISLTSRASLFSTLRILNHNDLRSQIQKKRGGGNSLDKPSHIHNCFLLHRSLWVMNMKVMLDLKFLHFHYSKTLTLTRNQDIQEEFVIILRRKQTNKTPSNTYRIFFFSSDNKQK